MPKLNLAALAAHVDESLFDVKIVDETVEDIDFRANPDLVGITVLTNVSKRSYEIASHFRKQGAKIVLGGFHVFFLPDEAEQHADSIVIGEAEGAWDDLLRDFLAGELKNRYQTSSPHDMTSLPKPRLDLLKQDAYTRLNIMETARGCPHQCAYCSVTLFWGGKFRFRPIGEVVDEIRSMPPGKIIFVDDNIIGSPQRAKELFQAMLPLKRRWSGQADLKISRDPELLRLCAESGCRWLFMGLESTNVDNLRDVGKAKVNDVPDYSRGLAAIHQAGIKVFGSFILGLDHDDITSFDRTVQFCVDNRLAGVNFYILTPLPFTKLFDEMDRQGRILHKDWSLYDMNHVVFKPALMSPEELLEGYLNAYRSLYSMGSIIKRCWNKSDLGELLALNVGRKLNYSRFKQGCLV